jgi:hypothetical protein
MVGANAPDLRLLWIEISEGALASLIGDLLGPALGIALSPVAVVGLILMLVSAGGMAKAWAFLLGWGLGATLVLVIVSTLISGSTSDSNDEARPIVATMQLLLGVGMLYLAWRTWKGRPAEGEEPNLPAWMQKMDTVTVGKAATLGLMLCASNPKNLALLVSSAGAIGQASIDGVEVLLVNALFILVACLGMLGPILVSLAAGDRAPRILGSMRQWLIANNATIMAVLLLILGANVLGKGIGGF